MDSRMRESDRETVHDQATSDERQLDDVLMQSNGKAWRKKRAACHDWAISAANDVDRLSSIAGTVNHVQSRACRSAEYFDRTGFSTW